MTDCISHPENLKPGKWYRFTFRSTINDDGKTFSIVGRFERLGIGDDEMQKPTGQKLKVLIKVGKEEFCRKISWSRITHVEPHA